MNEPAPPALDAASATLASPVRSRDRIQALDVLRGFALLGMILVHFHVYMETDASGAEGLIGWFTWIGIESKAWGTFAFLFGVGFAVLMSSFDARSIPVVPTYLRRLAGLAVFGFIAEAFFGFHVLLEYAIWGVPLIVLRRASSRTLFVIAILAVITLPAVRFIQSAIREPDAAATSAGTVAPSPLAAARQQADAAREGDSYTELLRARLRYMKEKYGSAGAYIPDVNLALFILGLLAYRHGIFNDPRKHARTLVGWMVFGFSCWALFWLMYALQPAPVGLTRWALPVLFMVARDQWLCFTYIGAIVLLLAYRPQWAQRLSPIGIAGRMALTNYMLQVISLDFLASGYGVGLNVRPLLSVAGSLVMFVAMCVFSRWWLDRFRFGPAEWAWRCFTYLRMQPIREPTRLMPDPQAA